MKLLLVTLLVVLLAVLVASQASGYKLLTVQWNGKTHNYLWSPCLSISYAINTKRVSDKTAAIRDVKRAFAIVSQASGFSFKYKGTTSEIPKTRNGKHWWETQKAAEIVVAFVNAKETDLYKSSPTALAIGTSAIKVMKPAGASDYILSAGRGAIIYATKSLKAGFAKGGSRGSTLVHEICHVLGLDHVKKNGEVMHTPYNKDRPKELGKGDRAGLVKVGRKSRKCYNVPADVWTQI